MSTDLFSQALSQRLDLQPRRVQAVLKLMDDGCTIPFIARYRKDQTQSMTDEQLRHFEREYKDLKSLEDRREAIRSAMEKREQLTPDLTKHLNSIRDKAELEDFYRPYKSQRQTKASKAKKLGLEPLARKILLGGERLDPKKLAQDAVDALPGVESVDKALAGAADILVDDFANNPEMRKRLRQHRQRGRMTVKASRGKKQEAKDSVYRDLVDLNTNLHRLRGHRIMAINRGEREGLLSISVEGEKERELKDLNRVVCVHNRGRCQDFVKDCVETAWKDRLGPACERDVRRELTEQAHLEAIENFRINLRQQLMAPPLKSQTLLAVDPGFRNGCKCAIVDGQGQVKATFTVYPHSGSRNQQGAQVKILSECKDKQVELIAIGNGTASRETMSWLKRVFKGQSQRPRLAIVSEAGASIYSASAIASEEFPDLDVTVRGAISIARRVLDPLAELVKIEPGHLGIGQYQHDLDAKRLNEALTGVVEQVVNEVGVHLNRASYALLKYVAGLNERLAKAIVKRRNRQRFNERADLLSLKGLGPKIFQQAAGFLRIPDSPEILDRTAVHPESYALARRVAAQLKTPLPELIENERALNQVEVDVFLKEGVGQRTVEDVIAELKKPSLDPRGQAQAFEYSEGIDSIDDLKEGQLVSGTITNLTDFGAFVDLGIHKDGLIHISRFGERIRHPSDKVRIGQNVKVQVESIDKDRGRIGLIFKG